MAQHMPSVQHIPPVEVQRLAEAHSLGIPTASYSERSSYALVMLLFLLLCSLFWLGWFILALFGSAPEPVWSLLTTAVFGGGTIGFYEQQKRQVHVYTEGFVYLRRRKRVALRFEQIETLWYETTESDDVTWDFLRLRKTDGSELKVIVSGFLRNSSEIYRTIEGEFVRIRLPAMLERYEAGNDIAFGELSVNKLGLTRKGETLPWSQVQSIDVGDQRVRIKKEGQKRGNWFNSRVPNPSLLRELVTHRRKMSDQPPDSTNPPPSPEWREWQGGYGQPGYWQPYEVTPAQPPNFPSPSQTGYPPVVTDPIYSAPIAASDVGNGFAVTGLVFAIISLVAFLFIFLIRGEGFYSLVGGQVSSILGIVLSARGRRSTRRRTMATVGLILSIVSLVLLLLFMALLIVFLLSQPSQ